ncbi:hypothetical protein BDW74DRAFT_143793 [Aspergillus multicolor]|uniref:uncharacterized protein n=1 Tax=Aspergillus multicolor TaxID=41759 RepID=UPI003CCD8F3D
MHPEHERCDRSKFRERCRCLLCALFRSQRGRREPLSTYSIALGSGQCFDSRNPGQLDLHKQEQLPILEVRIQDPGSRVGFRPGSCHAQPTNQQSPSPANVTLPFWIPDSSIAVSRVSTLEFFIVCYCAANTGKCLGLLCTRMSSGCYVSVSIIRARSTPRASIRNGGELKLASGG